MSSNSSHQMMSSTPQTPTSPQPPTAATPIIKKVIAQMESEDGWVPLGAVGNQLANLASDFDPRTYGFRKLSDLVRKTNAFDVDQLEGKPLRIRVKQPGSMKKA
jgi:Fe-S-cluster formation regulator IscX/YfhJ